MKNKFTLLISLFFIGCLIFFGINIDVNQQGNPLLIHERMIVTFIVSFSVTMGVAALIGMCNNLDLE